MLKCNVCQHKVNAAWLQSNEWRETGLCGKCLWGEQFYYQVEKVCKQTRVTFDPRKEGVVRGDRKH